MIERMRFENFKALKDATLELGPFNVLVGPNGSGKSSVFQVFEIIRQKHQFQGIDELRTIGASANPKVTLTWTWFDKKVNATLHWEKQQHSNTFEPKFEPDIASFGFSPARNGMHVREDFERLEPVRKEIDRFVQSVRVHSFDPTKIPQSVQLGPGTVLAKDGSNLAAALDRLRDQSEENYDLLRKSLRDWLPEYDSILFDTPQHGHKVLKLRHAQSRHPISSRNLSEGTLVALALLLIAHDHNPPDLICLEEPERNIHPRLLKDVRDSLYKLSFPKEFGLNRPPIQLIITTHSPIFLNLLEDHPESIIIAEKHDDGSASFQRADKDPHFREIIEDARLGDIWVTGVLGGVPALK